MAQDPSEPDLDREMADLPPALRWREWMRRIEAVLFASAAPVSREDLARVVGQGASIDLLIGDLVVELTDRPYEIARVTDAWMFRTRTAYAPAIRPQRLSRSRVSICARLTSRSSPRSPIISRSPGTG